MTTIDARRWHDPAEITQVATTALAAHGVAEAREVAEVLVETSLLGVHTHGVRLLGSYLDELRRSVATATPEIVIVKDTGPVVQVDAGDALGVVAALHGARLAVQRAKTHGIGLIGVRRSNHFGAAKLLRAPDRRARPGRIGDHFGGGAGRAVQRRRSVAGHQPGRPGLR